MSKRIYVLVWTDADGNAHVEGYWNKPPTEADQHGYFKEHWPRAYDPENGERLGIKWELVELKGAGRSVPLPKHQRAGFKPEF